MKYYKYSEDEIENSVICGDLTKKEINACRMTCDEIYQKCMTNPYTIPAIPLEKCDLSQNECSAGLMCSPFN